MSKQSPLNSTTRDLHCDLCGSNHIEHRYALDAFSIVACKDCGLVFLDIDLNREKLSQMYSGDYYNERTDYFQVDASADASIDNLGFDATNFNNGLELLRRYRPEQGRLLDVGCALGGFLRLARNDGWTVAGVDISEFAAQHCRERFGLDVQSGLLNELNFAEESFDVITLWDVLEHFEHPLQQLRHVNRILKSGGIMLVDTPNERALIRTVACWLYRLTGGKLSGPLRKLFHQYHLYYFNQATLQKLLNDAGFELIHLQGRPLPIDKGRAGFLGRLVVQAFSWPEKWFKREFELVALARKIKHLP